MKGGVWTMITGRADMVNVVMPQLQQKQKGECQSLLISFLPFLLCRLCPPLPVFLFVDEFTFFKGRFTYHS
jgi:hypothetical protein